MSDYINENADIFDDKPVKKGFTVKKLFKFIGVSIIILVYAVLFTRCMMSNDSKLVKKVLMNDVFLEAYNQNPEEFTVEQYAMKSAWVAIRENRLIEFNYLYHVPMARQLQFSVKFNMDLPGCEYQEEIPFRLKLTDDEGKEYSDYWYEFKEKSGYGYIRVCFENIDLISGKGNDENGMPLRHTYKLTMDMVNSDGTYSELCDYKLYDGASINKNVKFKVD